MHNVDDHQLQTITSELPTIIKYFKKRFLGSSYYGNCSRKDDAEFYFDELLEKYLGRHSEYFKPIEGADENYDVVCAFRDSFKRNMERFVYFDLKRTLSKMNEVSLDASDAAYVEKLSMRRYQEEDMSDQVERHIVQEKLENLNREFNRYCNTLEKKVIEAMTSGCTMAELIEHVGFTQSGNLLSLQEARHIRNVLEYRLVCFYAPQKFLDPEMILKGLNRHPNLNKRFFGAEKLTEMPDKSVMIRVAKGNTKRPEKHEHKQPQRSYEEVKAKVKSTFRDVRENHGSPSRWAFCTPWYKNEKYDSPKVFINKSGYAYSHIDERVWDIFAPDGAA